MLDYVPSAASLVRQIGKVPTPSTLSTKSHIPSFIELQAQQSKERASIKRQKVKKDLIYHFSCLLLDYMRNSTINNKKLVISLMENFRSPSSLGLLLNSTIICTAKTAIYSLNSGGSSNFLYDKALNDHTRSLDPTILKNLNKMDLEWYKDLDDFEQILIVLGLIRSSGLYLSNQILRAALQMHQNREQQKNSPKEYSCVELKVAKKSVESEYNLQPIPNLIGSIQRPKDLKVTRLSLKLDLEFKNVDPNNPYLIEVKKKRAMWDAMIKKYKEKVEPTPKVESHKENGGKNDKVPKKPEKGKDKKEQNYESVDQIQILPIWIVLKICSYLDKKTLANLKIVNSYWEFAVNELDKVQKARKQMDKILDQWEKKINQTPTTSKTQDPKKSVQIFKKSGEGELPKKRLMKLSKRGTCELKLRPKAIKNLYTQSIVLDAIKQTPQNYILPVKNFEVFPRDFPLNTPSLYNPPAYLINELGFSKIVKTTQDSAPTKTATISLNSIGNNSITSEITNSYWL